MALQRLAGGADLIAVRIKQRIRALIKVPMPFPSLVAAEFNPNPQVDI